MRDPVARPPGRPARPGFRGDVVKIWRENSSPALSANELAELLTNLGQPTTGRSVRRWEDGSSRPNLAQRNLLAQLLRVAPQQLDPDPPG
jgi:DNA-binding transcriptional regulator YiaG